MITTKCFIAGVSTNGHQSSSADLEFHHNHVHNNVRRFGKSYTKFSFLVAMEFWQEKILFSKVVFATDKIKRTFGTMQQYLFVLYTLWSYQLFIAGQCLSKQFLSIIFTNMLGWIDSFFSSLLCYFSFSIWSIGDTF